MRKTNAQLQKDIEELKEKLARRNKILDEIWDRNKISALYLQALRVMLNHIGGNVETIDFDRLLDTLDQHRYPEGF